MDRILGYRPKSIILVFLIFHQPAPLEYDWRVRFGFGLGELRRIGWVTAWQLTSEILRDPFSHTTSALRGDKYVPDPATAAALDLFDGWRNAKRGRGQIPQYATRPWAGTPPVYDEPKAIDNTGRDERRARLDEFSRRRNELLQLD